MLATRSVAAVAAVVIAAVSATVMGSVHSHSASTPARSGASSNGRSSVAAAVVGVGPATDAVTLSFNQRNVHYAMCPGSVRPAIQPGDFTTASVSGGCLSGLSISSPPTCAPSVEVGAYMTGRWVAANPAARSLLFETSGASPVTLAARWCAAPTVRAADGISGSLAQIPKGATVRVVTSVDGWVTGVIVQRPARSGLAG